MKVLIATGLYPPEIGGPATYSKILHDSLPQKGIEVQVIPFRTVKRFPKVIRHIAYALAVFREGRKVDCIYAQDPISVGLPSAIVAWILRKPFILKMVGDYAWEQSTQRYGFSGTIESFQHAELSFAPKMLRWLERFVARRAVRIVVPSKYLAKIVSMWGVKTKVSVIYNGVEELKDTGNKPVLRGLLKFHGKLLISVGRLVPWKGFDALIELLPSLRNTFADLKLMIVGSGPDMEALEKKAESLGLSDEVIFTGALDRDVLIRYLRASDVFVLNTAYEGLSHQILEVMSVGVPVVTTNIGGNPEIIEHEKDGFLVPLGDTKRLSSHVSNLLSSGELRTKIVAAGKRKAKQFSNERMVEETAKFLKSL